MAAAFALVFLVVPLVELYLIIQVGSVIGALNTIALLVVMSVAGGYLMRREGLGVARRIRAQLRSGQLPGRELTDAFLILFGGALMMTPGFLTDVLGLSLLLPPVRAAVRGVMGRRFRSHIVGRSSGGSGHSGRLDV